jgi:Mrp family chromosome partitioning ATPase
MVPLDEALRRLRLPQATRHSGVASNGHSGSGDAVLEFLPAGTLPPNPGEFLGTSGVERLLVELRNRADFVFIDAAPLLPVGDTLPLSAKVDGIVIVTQFGVVSRPMLDDLSRELQTLPTPKLGFILTGADTTDAYGYGYGYGHGHGTEADSPQAEVVPSWRASAGERTR